MDNENKKTQAELYREERKERLAKVAEKKAKKNPKFSRAKRKIGKVIAIILVIALCLGAVGGILNFFGTPQKLIKISVADKDLSFSMAEFNYYYYQVWYSYSYQAMYYEQNYASYYGEGAGVTFTGYDYTKSPESQEYKSDYESMTGVTIDSLNLKDNQVATWADVFKYAAVSQIIESKYGAIKAREAGIELTEEEQTSLDDNIESVRESATENDYSLNRYLRAQFGNGITEKLLRNIIEQGDLATSYFAKVKEDTENSITKEDVESRYKENADDYNIVTVRLYTFSTTLDESVDDEATEKAYAATKADAESFAKSVTDEASFVSLAAKEIADADEDTDAESATLCEDYTKADFEAQSEDMANWVYSADRAVGDISVFDIGDGSYDVVMMIVLPHKDTSSAGNNVRHILISFPEGEDTDEDGNAVVSDAQKEETKAKAEEVLAEYEKNPTEENFINLTKEYTGDVDDEGNPNNDGLYEDVTSSSQYVDSFKNWACDESRKPGDVGIVESDYGYHIMYYVGSSGESWYNTIKDEIISEAVQAITDKIDTDYVDTFDFNNIFLKWAFKSESKQINNIITNRNTSS